MDKTVPIGSFSVGAGEKPLLIAGPCVIESEETTLRIAEKIASLGAVADYHWVFKASYLKDNRSAAGSFRGPGRSKGLALLRKIRDEFGCPVLSDVHGIEDVDGESCRGRQRDDYLDCAQQSRRLRRSRTLGRLKRATKIRRPGRPHP